MLTLNVLLPVMLACRPQAPTVPPATTGATSDTEPGTVPTEPSTSVSPCFERDVVPLFSRSCGSGDNGCHSAVAYAADPQNDCYGWLSLEDRPLGSTDPISGAPTGCPDRDLYARLTDLASWQCYVNGTAQNGNQSLTIPYVVPGDPDGSYLW